MLTLPITNAAGEVTSWKVSCSWTDRMFIVVKQQNGDLLVMDNVVNRVVAAGDAEWFLRWCKNSVGYFELADYCRWEVGCGN